MRTRQKDMKKEFFNALKRKCIHFTGRDSKYCLRGVSLSSVIDPKDNGIPCNYPSVNTCILREFPSDDDCMSKLEDRVSRTKKHLTFFELIKKGFILDGKKPSTGRLDCPFCSGHKTIKYVYDSETTAYQLETSLRKHSLWMICSQKGCLNILD